MAYVIVYVKKIVSGKYEITQTTKNGDRNTAGSETGYFYTILGRKGETSEHSCDGDRSEGATSSCTIEDSADIGDFLGLRIRNSGTDAWWPQKIEVVIDGKMQRAIVDVVRIEDKGVETIKANVSFIAITIDSDGSLFLRNQTLKFRENIDKQCMKVFL